MTDTRPDFPDFRDPPITEVVVGVTIRDAARVTVAHLGELWQAKWEAAFPTVQEHPPYASPLERLDAPPLGPSFSWEIGARPELRLWFVSSDGQEIIQAQRDWLACNWRKVLPGGEYDRWPARRAAFERAFSDYARFVEDRGLGKLTPLQCEVTYINHVRPSPLWQDHGDLWRLLRLATSLNEDFPPKPEQMQLAASYLMRNDLGQPVGRLHVTVQPGFLREESESIFVINLTARGLPEGEGLNGALKFLDRGRAWIVRTFVAITTPEAQEVWGKL